LNTINPPGNEEACALLLGGVLERAGFRIRTHSFGPGRVNLLAEIGGDERAPLCFTGHIDVVPLGTVPWKKDPFAGETDAGRLYGRGSSDMKSGVAAFVAAAVSMAPHLERTPGISLVITAGEETGCEGAFHLQRDGCWGAGALVVAVANYPSSATKARSGCGPAPAASPRTARCRRRATTRCTKQRARSASSKRSASPTRRIL
jgi:succinyl-diaminopimelate desuccinylase